MLARESANPLQRDFAGLDCNGWVYDLYRPDQPYGVRGLREDGSVRRPRLWDDLSGRERATLKEMELLSLLNFANSAFFGFPRIWLPVAGTPTALGVFFTHHLTSFVRVRRSPSPARLA